MPKHDGQATVASFDSQYRHCGASEEIAAPQLGQLRVCACMIEAAIIQGVKPTHGTKSGNRGSERSESKNGIDLNASRAPIFRHVPRHASKALSLSPGSSFAKRYLTLLNSTTSLLPLPRETASHLRSREKSKHDMRSAPKFVSCAGAPPSIGKLQRFEMPPRVST